HDAGDLSAARPAAPPPRRPRAADGGDQASAGGVSRAPLSSRTRRRRDPGPIYCRDPAVRYRHGRATWVPALASLGRDDSAATNLALSAPSQPPPPAPSACRTRPRAP